MADLKQAAMAFYDLVFNQARPREAIDRYVGDEYIQHNPHVADGKEAFIEYCRRTPISGGWRARAGRCRVARCAAVGGGGVTYPWEAG